MSQTKEEEEEKAKNANNNEEEHDDDAAVDDNLCFLKISIAGVVRPTPIVIQLDAARCPKTCQNFKTLCASQETTSRRDPRPSYRGCEFHRVMDNFMVQTGDFERFDGTGGHCVLSEPQKGGGGGGGTFQRTFDDEDLTGEKRHGQAGIVSMANAGRNTNGSQFFITLKATPHLDGKHVVFGRVLRGMEETVVPMTTVERQGDRPVALQKIVICDCGIGDGQEGGDIENNNNNDHSSGGEEEHRRKLKKQKKKKKKKHKKRNSRKRTHYDSNDEEESSVSSSESDRPRKKRRKDNRRSSKQRDSDSDDSSSDRKRKRRPKEHHKKRKKHDR
jgi:peptidyl-prolyl isomerase G (cyclophilin G)